MQDGKCAYQEKVNMIGTNTTISCKFTAPQIKELTTVMEAYNTLQNYSKTEDLSTLEGVYNNPIANVWSKYLNNPEVCNISSDAMQQ